MAGEPNPFEDIRSVVVSELKSLFEEDELSTPDFTDELVLLDTDLDSLGFAVLVTRLDERLGFDPFSLLEDPVYPVTLGDFVEVYQRFRP